MEIENCRVMHVIIEQVDPVDRTSAAGVMWFAASKFIIFFVINIVMLMLFIPSSYELISENKRRKQMNDRASAANRLSLAQNQVQTIETVFNM